MYYCIIFYELTDCKLLNSTLRVYVYINLCMYEYTSMSCESYHTTSNKYIEVQTVFRRRWSQWDHQAEDSWI